MFVKKLYDFLILMSSQDQFRYVSPAEFNLVVNQASMDMYSDLLPDADRLMEYFKAKATIQLNGSGIGDLPGDYEKHNNAESTNGYPIDILLDAEWVARKGNVLKPPEKEYPIARVAGKKIEVLPNEAGVILYYLRRPVDIKYGYTVSGNDYVFSEKDTVDTDWPWHRLSALSEKTLSNLGVPLKDDLLLQFEQFKKSL